MIKEDIEKDLKSAMLAGEKDIVSTLRTIKGVILDEEVRTGKRQDGLDDNETIKILQKEQKKRLETAEIFENAGDTERASKEREEAQLISKYTPEMMQEDDVRKVVEETLSAHSEVSMRDMSSLIKEVKDKIGPAADGSMVAKLVKEAIEK